MINLIFSLYPYFKFIKLLTSIAPIKAINSQSYFFRFFSLNAIIASIMIKTTPAIPAGQKSKVSYLVGNSKYGPIARNIKIKPK